MKYVVIGDIHGHDSWKEILSKEKDYDRAIFLGDYLDSFTVKPEQQIENLKEILDLDDEKTIRLLGNHDYQYLMNDSNIRYSGYNSKTQILSQELLEQAIKDKKIKIIHVDGNNIFSHAGVSDFWLHNVAHLESPNEVNFDSINLNTLDYNLIKGYDPYGNTISQSPIWIRPQSLRKSKLEEYVQIVGHTHMTNYVNIDNCIHMFDCLGSGYYGVVDIEKNGNIIVVKKI